MFIGPECKCTYTMRASVLTGRPSKIAYMKTLSERVVEAREAANLDKAQLRTEMNRLLIRWGLKGISHSALSQIETGSTKTMKAHTAMALGRVTGYRPEYLLFGERPAISAQPSDLAVARTLQQNVSQPPSEIFDTEYRAVLAMAIETLENKLKKTRSGMSAAGKAELIGYLFQWVRAGETRAAIDRKLERMLVAISKLGDV